MDTNLSSQIKGLMHQQRSSWPLLAQGYRDLESVRLKQFDFIGFTMRVQYNPARIISSTAEVDPESVQARPCFLCPKNRPIHQKGVIYGDEYLVLCNPYPIFHEHFTIAHVRHEPQSVKNSFESMLNLAADLGSGFTVLYNGPECGASAPDHMHFQAGNTGLLPLEDEYDRLKKWYGTLLVDKDGTAVHAIDDALRRMIVIESGNPQSIKTMFENVTSSLAKHGNNKGEPMMNVLSWFDAVNERWRVTVFPRRLHRPSFYFAEGDDRILVSPAAVDFGGLCITPRETDFKKIKVDDIVSMFGEVTISKDDFIAVTKEMIQNL